MVVVYLNFLIFHPVLIPVQNPWFWFQAIIPDKIGITPQVIPIPELCIIGWYDGSIKAPFTPYTISNLSDPDFSPDV